MKLVCVRTDFKDQFQEGFLLFLRSADWQFYRADRMLRSELSST